MMRVLYVCVQRAVVPCNKTGVELIIYRRGPLISQPPGFQCSYKCPLYRECPWGLVEGRRQQARTILGNPTAGWPKFL
jgi:hypothetical protein